MTSHAPLPLQSLDPSLFFSQVLLSRLGDWLIDLSICAFCFPHVNIRSMVGGRWAGSRDAGTQFSLPLESQGLAHTRFLQIAVK